MQSATPAPDDLLQAEAVIAVLPFDILYFLRVNGTLSMIEIEPIFSFGLVPAKA